jgi:hypothetical protein
VAIAAAMLLVSVLVLTSREHTYERDPALRARAGLVTAESDISLMRPLNFSRVLGVITKRTGATGVLRSLSVTPSAVEATVLSATGAETIYTVTPGLQVETNHTGDRVSHRAGVSPRIIGVDGPERILTAAQRRFGLRPLEFDRLELDLPVAGKPAYWSASWSQPTDDEGVLAALDGRHLHRPFKGRR